MKSQFFHDEEEHYEYTDESVFDCLGCKTRIYIKTTEQNTRVPVEYETGLRHHCENYSDVAKRKSGPGQGRNVAFKKPLQFAPAFFFPIDYRFVVKGLPLGDDLRSEPAALLLFVSLVAAAIIILLILGVL